MTNGVILVDFDNVFYGRTVNAANVKSKLEDFLVSGLTAVDGLEHVDVRLYGGWKNNAGYTNQASVLLGCLETVKSGLFPYIYHGKSVLGDVELVTSQYNLNIEWTNTLQEKTSRHHLSVRTLAERHCHHNPEHCPLHLVAQATRGHQVACPLDGCEHIDVSQLTRLEQKMVDSMMTCDILEYTNDDSCTMVEVVSDDVDLHPALALAGERYSKENGVSLLLLINNRKKLQPYRQLLGAHNVMIQLWQ